MKNYRHYINGAYCDPASGDWFDTENPYTGEVWAKVARGKSAIIASSARQPAVQ